MMINGVRSQNKTHSVPCPGIQTNQAYLGWGRKKGGQSEEFYLNNKSCRESKGNMGAYRQLQCRKFLN
jgi:hypothetical protein